MNDDRYPYTIFVFEICVQRLIYFLNMWYFICCFFNHLTFTNRHNLSQCFFIHIWAPLRQGSQVLLNDGFKGDTSYVICWHLCDICCIVKKSRSLTTFCFRKSQIKNIDSTACLTCRTLDCLNNCIDYFSKKLANGKRTKG